MTATPPSGISKWATGKRRRVGWYVTHNGKQHERSQLHATKAEAEAEARIAETEDDIRSGRYLRPEDARRLFRDVAPEWSASKHAAKGPSRDNYRE